jgi:hypothetical protein
MEKTLQHLNNYASLLSFVTVLVAAVIYFTGFNTDLTDLKRGQGNIVEAGEKNIKISERIEDSLKEKDRDHIEFSKQMTTSNRIQTDMVRVMDRLEITLNSIDKKLEK